MCLGEVEVGLGFVVVLGMEDSVLKVDLSGIIYSKTTLMEVGTLFSQRITSATHDLLLILYIMKYSSFMRERGYQSMA